MSVDTRSWDIASWYPTSMITYDEAPPIEWDKIKKFKSYINSLFGAHSEEKVEYKLTCCKAEILGKCNDCISCYTRTDGVKVCLYSKNGKPNDETCNYERKKR